MKNDSFQAIQQSFEMGICDVKSQNGVQRWDVFFISNTSVYSLDNY
ncbi:MAG: hypothetical protein WCK02_02395 [Bacteroidota bacterium]